MKTPDLQKYDHINMAVYNLIQPNSEILDIGCWNGALGDALIKEKHCAVDGVDQHEGALEQAKQKGYRETYCLDLNNTNALRVQPARYDFIIFADVLEHLLYPESIIRFFTQYLKPDGLVIVSLPNIAFFTCRIRLLLGKFNYKELGIMDKTHVKFYTLKTMKEMFEHTKLEPIKMIPHNELAKKYFVFQILKHIWPKLFTIQFVFLLKGEKIIS